MSEPPLATGQRRTFTSVVHSVVSAVVSTARRASARTPVRLALFAVLALVATWPLLAHAPALNEFRDAHVLGHYETFAAASLTHFHQAPLWDPYYCGGMYVLGTPQARFVSPSFLFTLFFGEARGEALSAFAMILIGLEGTFRYARSRGAAFTGAMLAAPMFALGGIFAASPGLGWTNFFAFELLPWAAYGVRRATRGERSGVVIAAVALAWCVGFGGTYAAPMSALWCAVEVLEVVLLRARRPREALRAVGMGALIGALALGLAAIRLWPVVETMLQAPRIIGGTPGSKLPLILKMLFFDAKADSDEGGFFLGALVVPAILFGLLRKRSVALLVIGWLCAWLATGYGTKPSLFAMLRELPLYTTLRYPERFLILMSFAASAVAACGVTRLAAMARSRKRRPLLSRIARPLTWGVSLLLLASVVPLVMQGYRHDEDRGLSAALPTPAFDAPFHQARGNRWALEYFEPLNRGSLSCWEAYPVPQSALLRGDLQAEEYLLGQTAGTVHETRWSPNAIDLDVDTQDAARVAVNQNWNAGWRVNVGEVKSERGLLVVELPAGKHSVELRFSPVSATGGAIVTLVSLLALLVVAFAKRLPGVLPIALAGPLPMLAYVACFAIFGIPRANHDEARAPTGDPVITDSLPPWAMRTDVTFKGGVALEAVALSNSNPAPGEAITLELDWRRDAVVERGLGIFVHIEQANGDPINGDHVLLSGVLDLEDAPPNRTLRDLLPLAVPDDAAGKEWKVWVGLWRVRRGGKRVEIVSSPSAKTDENRVLVTTFIVKRK